MNSPKVSVIIPTYNRKEFLLMALESVFAQTYSDYEVIVIDDGSTDGSEQIVREKFGNKVRYYWQFNQDRSAARNKGIEVAKGKFLALLDSDDLWLPEKLQRQTAAIEANPNLGAIFCQANYIDKNGNRIPQEPAGSDLNVSELSFEKMIFQNVVPGPDSTGLFRKDLIVQLGGFDPQIAFGEDWDLEMRILSRAKIDCLPMVLVSIRLHEGQQTYFLENKDRVLKRFEDKTRTLEKMKEYFPEPGQLRLIQEKSMLQKIETSLALLRINEYILAGKLLDEVNVQEVDHAKIASFCYNEILANSKIILSAAKEHKPAEEYLMYAIHLCNNSLKTDLSTSQCLLDLYEEGIWLLYEEGQNLQARTVYWKLIGENPAGLISVKYIKILIHILLGRKFVEKLLLLKRILKK
jgi:glycosyltransferase involved in cell wall biosynthesis